MIERGSGGVIIVASTAGMQPLPYEAIYAASKAFALNFTDALHTELKGTGVRCMSVNPGPCRPSGRTSPALSESQMPPGKIGPDQVVRESLAAYDRGARSFVPGRLMRWMMRAAVGPRAVKLRVMERAYRPRAGG